MRLRLLRRPSPAMAVALLALFVAVGGTSYAAAKISAKNIRTGAIGTRAVKDGALTARDIRSAAVGSRAVKNRALTSLDLRRDSIGGTSIREERLDANKLDVQRLKAVPLALNVPKDSVGAVDLGSVTRRFGAAVTVANGAVGKADAGCKKGEVVLSGGGRWASDVAGEQLEASYAGSDASWTAVGANGTGAPQRFQGFAMCLAP